MQEPKPPAPPEKSLSYMAWSLKEISENLSKLLNLMTQIHDNRSVHAKKATQDEISF